MKGKAYLKLSGLLFLHFVGQYCYGQYLQVVFEEKSGVVAEHAAGKVGFFF